MKDYVDQVWGWNDSDQIAFFDKHFQPDACEIIQADGADIGVLVVEENDDEIYLGEMQVLPEWQGQGIGSSVLRSLMERAAAVGKPLTLRVLHANPQARALYERFGFQPFKEIETHTYLRWVSSEREGSRP
jgi:ribosomal protein S18 acetylase RimI-like enzyme